jgi:hypothetical protein
MRCGMENGQGMDGRTVPGDKRRRDCLQWRSVARFGPAQARLEGGGHVLAMEDNRPFLAGSLRDFFPALNAPGRRRRQVSEYTTR